MRELVFDFIERLLQQEKIEKTVGGLGRLRPKSGVAQRYCSRAIATLTSQFHYSRARWSIAGHCQQPGGEDVGHRDFGKPDTDVGCVHCVRLSEIYGRLEH